MDNAFPKVKGMTVEIANELVRNVVCKLLDDPRFAVSASGPNHHSYRGGLAQHTFEVASLCLSTYNVCPVKDKLSKDLLMAGALLHDIGRMFVSEEEFAGVGAAHAIVGAHEVGKMCEQFAVPQEWKEQLMHVIVEHARESYSGVLLYSTREAFIISCADMLSASICAHELDGFKYDPRWDKVEDAKF